MKLSKPDPFLLFLARMPMTPVQRDRIAGLEGLHEGRKIALGRPQQQMDMIRYETITEELHLLLGTVIREFVKVGCAVSVIVKDHLAVIAPRDHVRDCAEIFDTRGARHERRRQNKGKRGQI